MRWLLTAFMLLMAVSMHGAEPTVSRVFEKTFESRLAYADSFNDVDVDVIFTKGSESWRVPTFWRGGSKWTVRFAPPSPGTFTYRLEATDRNNPDLNGHEGLVTINAYTGENALLRHGPPKVSANKRYFEYADGEPFYWLGDTWWSGMSTRLSWEGFQKLTADRKAKGYTVIQFVAGLVSRESGATPSTASSCNEGGCVWEPEFKRINPSYFDYMDRRLHYLVGAGITPALTGAWNQNIAMMGVEKMKKHWRYLIARYGAYPVFWILGGEVYDPPEKLRSDKVFSGSSTTPGGWTEVARYVRDTDPYHHPLTAHELPPPFDNSLQDESLTDFDMFQPSHLGWPSIAIEVAQLDMHYARTTTTKPLVVGEIGYEKLGGTHLEDFQRVAFWLAMLNGAAGHTYGAVGVWHSYDAEKAFHARKWSFSTWEDGMDLPGGYQVGLGAKLLQKYQWWRMQPHPEWVSPRGTTLLEPRSEINGFDLGSPSQMMQAIAPASGSSSGSPFPAGEWTAHKGDFRLPYAAGIPGQLRVIYIPCFGLGCGSFSFSVLGLESGVRYHAYFWSPDSGIKVDMGAIERPSPGDLIQQEKLESESSNWINSAGRIVTSKDGVLAGSEKIALLNQFNGTDFVATVDGHEDADAALLLRYHDEDNYITALYSHKDKQICIVDRSKGVDGQLLGSTPISLMGSSIRLTAEVKGEWAAVSISDGEHAYTSQIVKVSNTTAGRAGLWHPENDGQRFANFELRKCPTIIKDAHLERKLYDAHGTYKGEMRAPDPTPTIPPVIGYNDWGIYGVEKTILLDAWRPSRLPTSQDWVLILEHQDQ